MAFVFSQIEDQLNGQNSGNNIFGQNGQGSAAQSQGGASQGSVQLGTSSGDITSPGGGKTPQNQTKAQAPSASDIASKNQAQDIGGQQFVKQSQDSVQQAKQSIQGEADRLAGTAAKPVQQTSQESYNAALSGDPVAQQQLSSLLTGSAPTVGKQNINTSLENQTLKNLQSEAGREQVLKQQGGAGYTQGNAALDNMLLRNSPQFNAIMANLQQQQSQLSGQKVAAETQAQTQAQETTNKSYQTEQDRIKKMLTQSDVDTRAALGQDIDAAKAKDSTAAAASRAKAIKDYQAAIAQKQAQVKSQIGNIDSYDPQYRQQLMGELNSIEALGDQGNVDKYLKYNPVQYNSSNAGSAANIAKFNAIQSLLGGADRVTTQQGGNSGYALNQNDIDAALGKFDTQTTDIMNAQAKARKAASEAALAKADPMAYVKQQQQEGGFTGGNIGVGGPVPQVPQHEDALPTKLWKKITGIFG